MSDLAKSTTRRTFLATSALAATAAVSSGATAAIAAEAPVEESWDGVYDIVIAGAGMAGVSAAIAAIDEDDEATVLLLEKGDGPRGNSAYAAGYTLYADDADAVFTYLKAMDGRAESGDDVIRAFAEGLVENRDWFVQLGAKEEWLVRQEPGTTPQDALNDLPWDYPEFENYEAMGTMHFSGEGDSPYSTTKFLWDCLEARAGDRLTYLTETPFEKLVQDPQTKQVEGVVANGKRYKANLGVILACGGFENNPSMLFNYTGVRNAASSVPTLNTGDGIRAAMGAGADLWHMRNGQMFWTSPRNVDNDRFLSNIWDLSVKQHGITVAPNGRRFFMDYDGEMTRLEDGTAYDPTADPLEVLSTKIGWRHSMTQFGGQWVISLPMPETTWFVFDQEGLDAGAVPSEISTDPVADGWVYTADTIEELAEQLGLPADELAQTVSVWNGFCDNGFDAAFYRPVDTLTPVRTAPFYAMRCIPQFDNTNGGPRRGAGAEIIDVEGNPIPHLYECGELGSVWGEFFQGAGDYADCAAFGRIAARSCLANRQ